MTLFVRYGELKMGMIDFEARSIETDDPELENLFQSFKENGIPTLVGEENSEERIVNVPLGADTRSALADALRPFGYQLEEGARIIQP
jgi:predicted HAD superfamily phosphohydrolase YqeG